MKRSHELQTESDILVIYWSFEKKLTSNGKYMYLLQFFSQVETSTDINTADFPYIACFQKQTKLLKSMT